MIAACRAAEDVFLLVCGGHQQHGLLARTPQRIVDPMEAVDGHFDLRRHGVVIKRRDENHHVRPWQFPIQFVHRVLKDAGVCSTCAALAANAGVNAFKGCVKPKDGVTGFLCAAKECFRQQRGSSVTVRASGDHHNMHGFASISRFSLETRSFSWYNLPNGNP